MIKHPATISARACARILFLFCLLFHVEALAGAAILPPFDYSDLERKLKTGAQNIVEFQQISDTPIVYRAWGIWNFGYPAKSVGRVALDFKRYPSVFRYVFRCDSISAPGSRAAFGTWYVEGRAAWARVWAIGTIDTVLWKDSSSLRFIARQNENPRLEKAWSYNKSGWFNFRTHGVQLAAFVVSTAQDSCRVGIIAQGWVRKPMPEWLIRMATSVILPQLLHDLETEVRRTQPVPVIVPWYKRWFGF